MFLNRAILSLCCLLVLSTPNISKARYWTPTLSTSLGGGVSLKDNRSLVTSALATRYELSKSTFLSADYLLNWSIKQDEKTLSEHRLHFGLNYRFDLLQIVPWGGISMDYRYDLLEAKPHRFAPGITLGIDYLLSEYFSLTILGHYAYQNYQVTLLNLNYRFVFADGFDDP